MKQRLLLLPLALAACSGDHPPTQAAPALGVPAAPSASRNDDGERGGQSGRVVVSPENMRGWMFVDDNTDGPCVPANCRMVVGPKQPPLGIGSAELAANLPSDRNYLGLPGRYDGVPFRTITALSYWTYRQTPPDPNPLAISLQFNVDYNLTDANVHYQGRVVYEPYLTGATVLTGVWQQWNTMTGRGWYSTNPAAALAANPTAMPCTPATPCTWAELVQRYPNSGVHPTAGVVLLKAGGGWVGFRGNTDALTIGVAGRNTTYDFEPARGRGHGDGDDENDDDGHDGDHGGHGDH